MPRFVVLLHETPADYERGTHFDLMLEKEEVLLTWALDRLPTAGSSVEAERLPDHRLMYLDYEGPVSGDRGNVRRVDAGDFTWIEQQPRGYKALVRGQMLAGRLVIEQGAENAHRWRVALSD